MELQYMKLCYDVLLKKNGQLISNLPVAFKNKQMVQAAQEHRVTTGVSVDCTGKPSH